MLCVFDIATLVTIHSLIEGAVSNTVIESTIRQHKLTVRVSSFCRGDPDSLRGQVRNLASPVLLLISARINGGEGIASHHSRATVSFLQCGPEPPVDCPVGVGGREDRQRESSRIEQSHHALRIDKEGTSASSSRSAAAAAFCRPFKANARRNV